MKDISNSDNRSGFTLIELLVVIAIIGILAAILFPVFATAREKARSVACLSNLKQIGLAITQYEEDYDEKVPCGIGLDAALGWAGQIYPYVKSTQVFLCPSDPNPTDVMSYAYNENAAWYRSTRNPPIMPLQISQMTSPSMSVLLYEITNLGGGFNVMSNSATITNGTPGDNKYSPVGDGLDYFGAMQGGIAGTEKYATGMLGNACLGSTSLATCNNTAFSTSTYFTSAVGLHTGGANYLMADNHAKWLMASKVGAGIDASPGSEYYAPDGWYANCPGAPGYYAASVGCGIAPVYTVTFAFH